MRSTTYHNTTKTTICCLTGLLLPVPWICGSHVDGALPGQTHWLCRTFAHISQRLIDFLLRSCQANQKIAFSSWGISRCRVFKMFPVIAPWQSFLPWSGLYIMDCHEIIIACLWTNQLVEAEGNYFLCVLLSAHCTLASDNGPGKNTNGGKNGGIKWKGKGSSWCSSSCLLCFSFLFVFYFSVCYILPSQIIRL